MSDYSPYSLIHSSSCLLIVPVLSAQRLVFRLDLKFFCEIVFFQKDFWISDLRIWNTNHHNASSSIVTKVETFRDSSPADSHQDCSSYFLVCLVKYCFVVLIHCYLILAHILRLHKDFLCFRDHWDKVCIEPFFITILHQLIRGKEYQHTTWCDLSYLSDCHAEISKGSLVISILEGKVEIALFDALRQDVDRYLAIINNMRVFNPLLEIQL
jgi:hypothetical protein